MLTAVGPYILQVYKCRESYRFAAGAGDLGTARHIHEDKGGDTGQVRVVTGRAGQAAGESGRTPIVRRSATDHCANIYRIVRSSCTMLADVAADPVMS